MKDDPGYARYFAYLNLFVFFMLVIVLGASFPVMFVGWEGVGLCSYLLIGFWFNERINADAGKKAFLVNRIGDVGFLVAMLMIFAHTGSLDFQPLFAQAPKLFTPGGPAVTAIDRKSTRLNSSHGYISYAVFCLKKKKNHAKRDCVYSVQQT